MQTLKYSKEPIRIGHVKRYSIAFDEKDELISIRFAAHLDSSLQTCAGEFDSIDIRLVSTRLSIDLSPYPSGSSSISGTSGIGSLLHKASSSHSLTVV